MRQAELKDCFLAYLLDVMEMDDLVVKAKAICFELSGFVQVIMLLVAGNKKVIASLQ